MTYNNLKAYNILAIMLDIHLKNMKCIWNFVSNPIVVENNVKIVCPLLLEVHNHSNLTREPIEPMTIEKDDLFFGQVVLVNDVTNSILKNELKLFQKLLLRSIDHENPLVWWVEHVVQFSHVFFSVH